MAAGDDRVKVRGLDRLRATLARAADDIEDGSPATEMVAEYVAKASAQGSPRRTGRMAAGHRARTSKGVAQVENATSYAGYVYYGTRGNKGRPWILAQAYKTQPTWLRFYEEQAQGALDKVRGA